MWRCAMKIGMLNLFKKRKSAKATHEALMTAFNYKYANFKAILESNSELLKILTDIEHKLRGQAFLGATCLESQTPQIAFHADRMIRSFENLSGRPCPHLNQAYATIMRALQPARSVPLPRPISGFTIEYRDITRDLLTTVGGKNAVLGEVGNKLRLPVPMGFAVTTSAYDRIIHVNQLDQAIQQLKQTVDIIETKTIMQASEQLQRRIMAAEVPEDLAEAILGAYDRMAAQRRQPNAPLLVSMRSSAVMEDSWLSFAGQYLTVLNVPREEILEAYKRVIASLFTPRAIIYQLHMGVPLAEAAMGVACLEMVASKASGVMYTRDPLHLAENRIVINAVWGLGAYAVDGMVPPDTYLLSRGAPPEILDKKISEKPVRLISRKEGDVIEEKVSEELMHHACLSDTQAVQLAEYGRQLETYFECAQDVEWAMDENGRLVILQSRPLRLEPISDHPSLSNTPALSGYTVLLEGGDVACPGAASGPAVHVHGENDLANFPEDGILVSHQASAEFVLVMGKAKAIVAESGSVTGHLAALVKEYMVPTLLNAPLATQAIAPGTEITVDANHARIYQGRIPELLSAQPVKQPPLTEEHKALRSKTDLITPLNLFDPKSPSFAPQHCRTIHDIMRYVHEKAYGEIFKLGDMVADHERLSVRLIAPLPLDLYLIDLGGGLSVSPTTTSTVKPEQITSAPFKALLKGLLYEGLRSEEPRPVDLRGFFAVMSRQIASPQSAGIERFGDKSFGIISDSYLNFSSRVGYHYSVLDAYCGETATENYINFEFKGGAADSLRRGRRARMIQQVLVTLGFQVRTVEDRVTARFAKRPKPETEDRLDQLGRLLIFTRQMDMLMSDEAVVKRMATCFLDGNYQLCRTILKER